MWVSPYIIAIASAWIIAQGAKYVFAAVRARTVRVFRQLYVSGNMPSAHSASVVALTTLIGLRDGGNSALFGLALLFAAIVMYDAIMVRRSTGEQGAALQQLILELKSPILHPRSAKGHTPLEVAAGALLGGLIGIIVFLVLK